MFGKQNQQIDVNTLLKQIKESERDRYKLDVLSRFLSNCVQNEHNKFCIEKQNWEDDKKFYDFYYPFRLFDEDLKKIVDIVEFDLPEEVQIQVEEDYQYAVEWNNRVKEMKKGDNE